MMEIKNAKIKNVTVYLDHRARLTVSMELHDSVGFLTTNFILVNPVAVKNLTKIMEYIEVTKLPEMEGKIVRVGIVNEFGLIAIGHPIEDRFVEITNTIVDSVKELSKSELLKEYPERK